LDNINITEDNVSYGLEESIVIGLVFLFETSLSGFTWDIIKEQIIPFIKGLFEKKRKQDRIYVSISDKEKDYDIEILEDFNKVDIKIPNQIEIKLRK
jgi:hypothetical protein